eukprot:COSAG04_NODE_9881_length_824_cov_1.066207_1_plen_92_part_01
MMSQRSVRVTASCQPLRRTRRGMSVHLAMLPLIYTRARIYVRLQGRRRSELYAGPMRLLILGIALSLRAMSGYGQACGDTPTGTGRSAGLCP